MTLRELLENTAAPFGLTPANSTFINIQVRVPEDGGSVRLETYLYITVDDMLTGRSIAYDETNHFISDIIETFSNKLVELLAMPIPQRLTAEAPIANFNVGTVSYSASTGSMPQAFTFTVDGGQF